VKRGARTVRKARQVLFVHGGGEGAYAEDAKLAARLGEKLGPGYAVSVPKMPNEANPDYEVWKRRILEELAAMNEGAVVVGHSIGGSILVKIVSEGDLGRSAAGLFLVSTPFWYDHEVWRWKEVELPTDAAARVPRDLPLFFYHGRADEVVPFSHLDRYAKAFPGAVFHPLSGRNHQLNDDMTEVARDISGLRRGGAIRRTTTAI
jgi:predicted alpha/beta hydrolase family esterase